MNLRRASEILHVAQPALSRRIQDLEAELGVLLFERQKKRISLSAAGKEFLKYALRILQDVDNASRLVQLVSKGVAGTLRLGLVVETVRIEVVARAIQSFRVSYPAVQIDITPMSSQEQIASLLSGEIDAGFMIIRQQDAMPPELDVTVIDEADWVLAISSESRLAHSPALALPDLADADFLFFPRRLNPTLYDTMIEKFIAVRIQPRIVQHVANNSTKLALVAAGMGVCFTLNRTLEQPPSNVVIRSVDGFSVPVDISFACRKMQRSATLNLFMQHLVELMRKAA